MACRLKWRWKRNWVSRARKKLRKRSAWTNLSRRRRKMSFSIKRSGKNLLSASVIGWIFSALISQCPPTIWNRSGGLSNKSARKKSPVKVYSIGITKFYPGVPVAARPCPVMNWRRGTTRWRIRPFSSNLRSKIRRNIIYRPTLFFWLGRRRPGPCRAMWLWRSVKRLNMPFGKKMANI